MSRAGVFQLSTLNDLKEIGCALVCSPRRNKSISQHFLYPTKVGNCHKSTLAPSPPESEGRSCKHEKVHITINISNSKKTSGPGFYQPKHPFHGLKSTNLAHVYLFKYIRTVISFQEQCNLRKSPTLSAARSAHLRYLQPSPKG